MAQPGASTSTPLDTPTAPVLLSNVNHFDLRCSIGRRDGQYGTSPSERTWRFCSNAQYFISNPEEVPGELQDTILELAKRYRSGQYAQEHEETVEYDGMIISVYISAINGIAEAGRQQDTGKRDERKTVSRHGPSETTPLIESNGVSRQCNTYRQWTFDRRDIKRVRTAWERGIKLLRQATSKYVNAFLFAWRMAWPSKGSGLHYRPFYCGGVLALQCFLRWLFPNVLANLSERLQSPTPQDAWSYLQMACLFVCLFFEYLCECFQLWLWLPVAIYSESNVTIKAMEEAVVRAEGASGGLLADLGKAASPSTCLEIVLFTWFPIIADLLITVVDIWWKLGFVYGLCITTIALTYICLIVYNGRRLVPSRREEVGARRYLLSVMMNILRNPSATELAQLDEPQAIYQDKKKGSTTIEIFQNYIANAILYTGFFGMTVVSTAQQPASRLRNFTLLVTYMMRLQSPLKSMSASVPKILDRAVNFERLYKLLRV